MRPHLQERKMYIGRIGWFITTIINFHKIYLIWFCSYFWSITIDWVVGYTTWGVVVPFYVKFWKSKTSQMLLLKNNPKAQIILCCQIYTKQVKPAIFHISSFTYLKASISNLHIWEKSNFKIPLPNTSLVWFQN